MSWTDFKLKIHTALELTKDYTDSSGCRFTCTMKQEIKPWLKNSNSCGRITCKSWQSNWWRMRYRRMKLEMILSCSKSGRPIRYRRSNFRYRVEVRSGGRIHGRISKLCSCVRLGLIRRWGIECGLTCWKGSLRKMIFIWMWRRVGRLSMTII